MTQSLSEWVTDLLSCLLAANNTRKQTSFKTQNDKKYKKTVKTKIQKDQKEFDIVVVYQNRHHHHRHNDHIAIGQSVYDILLRMREGDFDIDYEEIRKVTT